MFTNSWRWATKVIRRLNCTVEAPKPAPTTKKKKPSVAQQMADYLQTSELFMTHYPHINPKLLKERVSAPHSVYCMSDSAADTMFSAIRDHLNPDTPIIELYPGLGLMTRHLLTLKPNKILAYESDAYFKSVMDSLAAENPGVLEIRKSHFLKVWRDDYKDKLDGGNRVKDFLPGIERKVWESDPAVQIIGVAANPRFFQYFVNSTAFQSSIFAFGRPELYLTVPPDIFWHINCAAVSMPTRYSKYVLFNLFFDYEMLCDIHGKCFVPWLKRGDRKTLFLKNYAVNRENYCVMKAVPKRDLLTVLPPNLLRSLWFFVYQGTLTTRNKVIPYLEKWIPGCGPVFIAQGLTIFTDFRDLNYNELLDVFLTFVSLPEYEECPFHAAMDSFFYKADDESLNDAMDLATSDHSESENVASP